MTSEGLRPAVECQGVAPMQRTGASQILLLGGACVEILPSVSGGARDVSWATHHASRMARPKLVTGFVSDPRNKGEPRPKTEMLFLPKAIAREAIFVAPCDMP